ncbi:hypothetical protein VP1G_09598 [Cytospora mali]|uniref:Uncharacterized protein n=1 Tax=Cytospora mali TaxID=578113 RepID=A0A194VF19_CYTMA|nr:hypothetical protein VP1G_09598 [Valsa mali var. pyri (nom. inval.)]
MMATTTSSLKQTPAQEGSRPYFDFVRDYDFNGNNMMLQAVRVVKKAKECAMTYGDTAEVLMMEAADKFRRTKSKSREYRFFGAVINQLKDPLPEHVVKRMERKEQKEQNHKQD